MGHVLTVTRFLHVRQEGGKVTVRQRYNKGDSLEALNAEEIERLVALGAAADEDAATDDAQEDGGSEEPSGTGEGQDGATDGQDDGTESEPETYTGDEWDKEALQAEAERRGLSKSGTKDDIAARLVEHDKEQAEE